MTFIAAVSISVERFTVPDRCGRMRVELRSAGTPEDTVVTIPAR